MVQRVFICDFQVRGDCDKETSLPERKVVQIGNFKIGLIHGHQVIPWGDRQSLAALQRQLDVDVLISGHTHKFELQTVEKACLLNPGSGSGAYSAISSEIIPSFALLCVSGSDMSIYVYQLKNGKVEVSKSTFKK